MKFNILVHIVLQVKCKAILTTMALSAKETFGILCHERQVAIRIHQ